MSANTSIQLHLVLKLSSFHWYRLNSWYITELAFLGTLVPLVCSDVSSSVVPPSPPSNHSVQKRSAGSRFSVVFAKSPLNCRHCANPVLPVDLSLPESAYEISHLAICSQTALPIYELGRPQVTWTSSMQNGRTGNSCRSSGIESDLGSRKMDYRKMGTGHGWKDLISTKTSAATDRLMPGSRSAKQIGGSRANEMLTLWSGSPLRLAQIFERRGRGVEEAVLSLHKIALSNAVICTFGCIEFWR